MLTVLLTAILVGACSFILIKIAMLTLNWLKNRITEKLKSKPGMLKEEAILPIRTILEQAPTIDLSVFGENITEDDILMVNVKIDGEIDQDVEVIQAVGVDDAVTHTLKQCGGVIKVGGLAG